MEVKVKRVFFNDWKYDDNEEDYLEETLTFDSSTFDEIRKTVGWEDGRVSPDKLLQYLHDNAVGKISASGETKYVEALRLGEIVVSLQCSYLLFCARDTIYGRNASDHYKDIMTEDEWKFLLTHNHLTGEEIEEDALSTNFDVCIWRYSDNKDLEKATQMSVTKLAKWLNRFMYKHSI